MKRILAAALLVAFAGAAHAQGFGQGAPGEMKGGRGHRGANDYRKDEQKPKVDEKAYQEALQKIPDSKEKYDPWGGVRSDGAKTAGSKTAGAKAKQPAR
jgi:hypothetical protein